MLEQKPEIERRAVLLNRASIVADVLNAGAVYDPASVVVDRDLVTGDSGANVLPFIDAICGLLASP